MKYVCCRRKENKAIQQRLLPALFQCFCSASKKRKEKRRENTRGNTVLHCAVVVVELKGCGVGSVINTRAINAR